MSQVSDHANGMNVEDNAAENNVTEDNVQEDMINVQEAMNNNTVGNNTVGNNTVGNNTVGNNTVGNNTVGNNTVGNNVDVAKTAEINTLSACGHAVHVDVACRREMDKVENIIRSMARTSAITRRCQLLETCTYMNARMYILQYIANYSDPALDPAAAAAAAAAASSSHDDDHGLMPRVWHLGQGISLRPSFDKNIVRVCVELQLPGSSENLPQSDAMIQLVDKKRKKNTD
jgi:hypothetical protein